MFAMGGLTRHKPNNVGETYMVGYIYIYIYFTCLFPKETEKTIQRIYKNIYRYICERVSKYCSGPFICKNCP